MDYQTDPVCAPIVKAASEDVLPEWMKTAALPDAEAMRDYDPVAFADPVRRLLPVHTKAACFASGLYAAAYPGRYDKAARERLARAADDWGITKDLSKAAAVFGAEKEAAAGEESEPGEKWALVLEGMDALGFSEKAGSYYPIAEEADTEDSMWNFHNDLAAGKLPPQAAHAAASSLLKAARRQGIPENTIPACVRDYGEERDFDAKRAAELVEFRTRAVPEAAMATYRELLKAASLPDQDLDELEGAVTELDLANGVKYAYEAPELNQPTPRQILRSGPTDEEKRAFVELAGVSVPREVAAGFPDTVLLKFAGEAREAVEKFRKEAADGGDASIGDESTSHRLLNLLLAEA